jgi:hypothetical protein
MVSLIVHPLVMGISALRACGGQAETGGGRGITIPSYLTVHYWWAYVHPMAVKLFERQWLANLILWGNYARLRDAALSELGASLCGHTLQVACVYGDLTNRLSGNAGRAGGSVDIVDVLPVPASEPEGQIAGKCPSPAPDHGRCGSRPARRQL